jgi:predicted metal-dependent HD superfamily phosphohydrolase
MDAMVLDLTRRYQEPHRHYHTLEHIAAMLHEGRRFPLDDEQTMAVWFHDAVYEAGSDENEAASAGLAARWLSQQGWANERIELVRRMVLDTKGHVPSCTESEPVLDLDLMGLAAPWSVFEANTRKIRAEYAHVPDELFVTGRRAFFAAMLRRERLFYTPWGRSLEALARANLERAVRG